MSISRIALTLVSGAALLGCSAMTDPAASVSTPRSLAKWVIVSPAAPTIAPGATLALDVELQDASGRVVTGQPEAWSSSDSSIATVSSSGVVTAHTLGEAKIYIASGTQSAYADLTVSNAAPPPRWVSVSPATAQVSVRSTMALFASVTDAQGHLVSNVPVTWTSSNNALAIVDTSGAITGIAPGSVSIIAHAGGNQAIAQLHVVVAATVTTPAPPPPAPVPPPPSSGSLYSGYSATSPHWPHIRTMMTDFYYGWTSAERTWAGQHYDYAMSGSGSAWKTVNTSVGHLPYSLEWTTIMPGAASDNTQTAYYHDMIAWYSTHTSFSLENAFLHKAGAAHDSAGRIVITIWGSKRWVVNPADAGARTYQVERFQRITASEDGAFVDESANILGQTPPSLEFPTETDMQAPQTATFAAIKAGIGNKTLMLNTAEYTTAFDRANALAAGAVHLEGMNNAFHSGIPQIWQWVESLASAGVLVDFVTLYTSTYANSIPNSFPHGNQATGAGRMKMWELASYYMVVPSNPANIALQLENSWALPYSSLWLRAQEANVGHPLGARVQASRGTDPLGQTYAVYTRDMDRALVIMRINQGWGSHSYVDGTAVSIPLPTTDQWLPLNADGTLGAAVTSVMLRNVEAAILVKKSRL
ncbi:MAG: Ig-like domain-containing protein [Gemmatimonadaceae bacterium]